MEVSAMSQNASLSPPVNGDVKGSGSLDQSQNKPPELWPESIQCVRDNILSRMTRENKELNIVFCPSGHLSQDCDLIKNIFDSDAFKSWTGNLKWRFVDLNCKAEDIGQLVDVKQKASNCPLLALSTGVGAVALHAIYNGSQVKKQEPLNSFFRKAIFLIPLLLMLGSQGCRRVKKIKGGEADKTYEWAESVMKPIWLEIAERFSAGLSIHVSFFRRINNPIIEEKIGAIDLLFGYSGLNNFEQLKSLPQKEGGKVIVIGQVRHP